MNEKGKKIIDWLDSFYSSFWYCLFVGLATAASEIFGLEVMICYVYGIIGILIPALFCKDMRGILPPLCLGYLCCSLTTNNAMEGKSLFNSPFVPNFIVFLVIASVSLIGRFIWDLIQKKRMTRPYLLFGFIAMTVAFAFGGIFSGEYSKETAIYGLGVGMSFFIPYLIGTVFIDKKSMPKDYFASILTAMGICLCLETLYCYIANWDTLTTYKTFMEMLRSGIVRTGWGIRNNVGGMLALTLVGPLYFASKGKLYPFWLLLEGIFFFATLFTGSRGGFFAAFAVILVSPVFVTIFSWKRSKPIFRILSIMVSLLIYGSIAAFLIVENDVIMAWIQEAISGDYDSFTSSRTEIWKAYLSDFTSQPGFGYGFYHEHKYIDPNFSYGIFPSRAHNTYIQILGSCGIVGALGYLYHRVETCFLLFKRFSFEKMMYLCVFIVFFILGMVDCHYFNIGPGMLCGVLLALLECADENSRPTERTGYLC